MREVQVTAERTYKVVIGSDYVAALTPLMQDRVRVAVVTSKDFSPDIAALSGFECEVHRFEVSDGESAKDSSTLLKLWDWLGAAGFTRSDLIIGVGGGAVTDLTGFVAATWLRGLDWVAVPTSLSGMVDAAVGGKTGINSDYGKNLIGAFHSPLQVVIDLNFLKTLSPRDLSAGMAEVIKCGFIADPEILNLAHNLETTSKTIDIQSYEDLIFRSVAVKASVVSSDFKESFAREALNYGHTLGHAIEIDSKYQLRHGEAVSIGLVFAAELALGRKLIDASVVALHRELLSKYNLPITYAREAWAKLLPLLALDKKARGKQLRFVALDSIGSTIRLEDLSSDELDAAYERISS